MAPDGERFSDRLVGVIGRHPKLDAFGLEVACRGGKKQRAIVRQPLRADRDALLRGGRRADDESWPQLRQTGDCEAAQRIIRSQPVSRGLP